MKIIYTTLLVIFATTLTAQNDKFTSTMEGAIAELYQAQAPTDFDPVINKLNRIGQAEASRWEPHYYAALGQIFKSFRFQEPETKDGLLDQAHAALDKAEAVDANNSEVVALRGFIDMMKISVDPGTRGQTLTPKAMGAFGKAMAMDPTNPRATLFMAQMKIGMAQFFGNGIEEPCAMVSAAEQLFANAQPTSSLTPMWGADMIGQYKEMCGIPASGE